MICSRQRAAPASQAMCRAVPAGRAAVRMATPIGRRRQQRRWHLRRRVFVSLGSLHDRSLGGLLPLRQEVVEAAVRAPAQLRLLALNVQHRVDGVEVGGVCQRVVRVPGRDGRPEGGVGLHGVERPRVGAPLALHPGYCWASHKCQAMRKDRSTCRSGPAACMHVAAGGGGSARSAHRLPPAATPLGAAPGLWAGFLQSTLTLAGMRCRHMQSTHGGARPSHLLHDRLLDAADVAQLRGQLRGAVQVPRRKRGAQLLQRVAGRRADGSVSEEGRRADGSVSEDTGLV